MYGKMCFIAEIDAPSGESTDEAIQSEQCSIANYIDVRTCKKMVCMQGLIFLKRKALKLYTSSPAPVPLFFMCT